MNRRSFLALSAVIPAAACGLVTTTNGVTTVNVAAFSTDANLIVNGLLAMLSAPSIGALVPAAALAPARVALTDAQTVVAQISATTGPTVALTSAQGWVSDIVRDANEVLAVLASVTGLPANVANIVAAVQALMPVIEIAVSLAAPAAASPSSMPPAQARAILAGV